MPARAPRATSANLPCSPHTKVSRQSEACSRRGYFNVGNRLPELLASCPLPCALPCERNLSNGLARAGTVGFLLGRGCAVPEAEVASERSLRVSPLMCVALKQRGDVLLMDVTGESALTGNQFFRYTLHCDACVEPPFRKLLLPATGQALTLSHLLGSPDDSSKSMVLDVLRVLVYMRVLVSSSADKPGARAAKPGVVDGSGVGGSGASHPKAAAKRGRDEDDERAAADELDEDMNEGKGGLLRTV
mmetsp:Transcript_31940/g.79092  ORF Transcript_31940/g.79092 Transcript_31940/m.79092 type:complete len:246 (+) Transcript_31940:832-1569(+)